MAFFLPSFFQKRILRYALSRLELLDTDALNLENLDIAWGKRSTVELREIGVHAKVSIPCTSCYTWRTKAEQMCTENCRFTWTARESGHRFGPDLVSSAYDPCGPLQKRNIGRSARSAGARER